MFKKRAVSFSVRNCLYSVIHQGGRSESEDGLYTGKVNLSRRACSSLRDIGIVVFGVNLALESDPLVVKRLFVLVAVNAKHLIADCSGDPL